LPRKLRLFKEERREETSPEKDCPLALSATQDSHNCGFQEMLSYPCLVACSSSERAIEANGSAAPIFLAHAMWLSNKKVSVSPHPPSHTSPSHPQKERLAGSKGCFSTLDPAAPKG